MDELLSHCMREISFDGDLGCDVARLNTFISSFYENSDQHLDDSFRDYVWALVASQSSVRVGLIPGDISGEASIAARPGKAKGQQPQPEIPRLEILEDAGTTPLPALVAAHGDRLRIAVDEATAFRTITGSDVRPAKLSAKVYSCLQLICRGRELGISVQQLGKTTGFDQKSCHFICKQLMSLNLIVKLPKPGVGLNFVVHKYFHDHSPMWKRVRAEEQDPSLGRVYDEEEASGSDEDDTDKLLQFRLMDEVDWSSDALFRARITALYKASPNAVIENRVLLRAVGVGKVKALERFFNARLDAMVEETILEREERGQANRPMTVKRFYRLASSDLHDETLPVPVVDASGLVEQILPDKLPLANETLQRQMIRLLDGAGTDGMTLRDLRACMGGYDRRTLEVILFRLSIATQPAHLADLGVAMTTENSGRERRNRYYTAGAYRIVAERDRIQAPNLPDLTELPEYLPLAPEDFYADEAALKDTFTQDAVARDVRRAVKDKGKNPLDANGRRLVGRPRKEWTGGVSKKPSVSKQVTPKSSTAAGSKRKRPVADAQEDVESALPVKKRRGRPPKKKEGDLHDEKVDAGNAASQEAGVIEEKIIDEDDISPTRRSPPVQHVESEAVDDAAMNKAAESDVEMSGVEANTAQPVTEASDLRELNISLSKGTATITPSDPPAGKALQAMDDVTILPADESQLVVVHSVASTSKRPLPLDSNPDGTPHKRKRNYKPQESNKVEISQLRRENELVKLAEKHNGFVVATTKPFNALYLPFLDEMVARGEVISTKQGMPLDGRTINRTVESLEAKGRVKTVGTGMTTASGAVQQVKVYYLPTLSQEDLERSLASLSVGVVAPMVAPPEKHSKPIAPVRFVDLGVDGGLRGKSSSRNRAFVDQLLAAEAEGARVAFLTEMQTMWQLYGFLCGKLARARELHLFTLSQLLSDSGPSKHIVSRKDRVVTFGYFFHELPLGTYCSIVSCLAYDENLELALRTPHGVHLLVQDLPRELAIPLQVGKARSRAKVQELLGILTQLGIVIPLIPSTSTTPDFTCENSDGVFPSAFERCEHPEAHRTQLYYKFNTTAPMFHHPSSELSPTFIGYRSIVNPDVGMLYWRELKTLSLSPSSPELTVDSDVSPPTLQMSELMIRDLKRDSCWVDYYVMSWYQKEYLRNQIDNHTGATPLDDPDPEKTRFVQLCYISCVPINIAQTFFHREAESWHKAKTRFSLDEGRTAAPGPFSAEPSSHAERRAQARIAKARQRRLDDWAKVLRVVHPDPINDTLSHALERLKARYMETALTKQKLAIELRIAIDAYKQNSVHKAHADTRAHAHPLVPQQATVDATPVRELVEQIKAKSVALGLDKRQLAPKKKRKSKKTEEVDDDLEVENPRHEDGRVRRRKFAWNAQFDELVRDVGTVIRVRCMGTRMDWAAAEKVFPGLSRVAIRGRTLHLREGPGGEAYERRLDDAWRFLWLAHRGSEELPDANPKSTHDFPIIEHIEFLRKYIDKQALRMGLKTITTVDADDIATRTLLEDVSVFTESWVLVDQPRPIPMLKEYIWAGISEEQRERELLKEALTLDNPPRPAPEIHAEIEIPEIVQSALKMMLSTPEERFNDEVAADMLKRFGEDATHDAVVTLLDRNVLAQTVHDIKKLHPGRTLKISDTHKAMFGGWLTSEMALDAVAVDDAADSAVDWQEWSPVAPDGDTAALLRMLVDDEVELDIDLSHYASVRDSLDWNSRKVDDGQIEGTISWRFKGPPRVHDLSLQTASELPSIVDVDDSVDSGAEQHGVTIAGAPASCSLYSEDAHVDCIACLRISLDAKIRDAANEEERRDINAVCNILEQADWRGLTRLQLEERALDSQTMSAERLWSTVRTLASSSIPLLLWTGYDNSRVVHAALSARWTVILGGEPDSEGLTIRRLPRRWLDIRGRIIEDSWNAAIRSVTSVIQLRPGISTSELRIKLAQYLDRQELNDVLEYLSSHQALRREAWGNVPESPFEVDVTEETNVLWFTGKQKSWYRIAADSAPS